jgi:hypothetical protein
MAVPIVCPASARPGMMLSFHVPLMQNIQYQSALYQPFQDTDTTNTCNISNEARLEGHTLNNSSATNSAAPDIYTKCYKNANTTTTDHDARSSSKVKSDIEIELSSINNNNRTTAIHHLKSARQRTLIVT